MVASSPQCELLIIENPLTQLLIFEVDKIDCLKSSLSLHFGNGVVDRSKLVLSFSQIVRDFLLIFPLKQNGSHERSNLYR
jgi:hypothetical protein